MSTPNAKRTTRSKKGLTTVDPSDKNRPDWDTYFMRIAQEVKSRSEDETQVGALIVRDNTILSTGYNGFASGVQSYEFRKAEKVEKLRWAVHAEQNAIFNAARVGARVAGATMYTTKFPCLKCTNAIIQVGISVIFTLDTKTYDDELLQDDGTRVLLTLTESGVRLRAPALNSQPGQLHAVK